MKPTSPVRAHRVERQGRHEHPRDRDGRRKGDPKLPARQVDRRDFRLYVVTCSPTTPLGELENKMQTAQIRRVPVVDTNGKLIGIVALGNIARSSQSSALHAKNIPGLAKTLAGITERRPREAAAAQ